MITTLIWYMNDLMGEVLSHTAHADLLIGAVLVRGVCAECGDRCHPRAVYCDATCRADHELRMAVLARQGRG